MVIRLAIGAALDAAIGLHQGKGSGELGLVRRVLDGFNPGDVMLADALYCNYFLIAALMAKGVDVLFEQNGSRITDSRRGQSLGTRDHIVRWPKPPTRPQWMTPAQYANAPDAITLRVIAHGAGRLRCQRGPTQLELQAHGAAVHGMGGTRTLERE